MTHAGQDLIVGKSDLSEARIIAVDHPETPPPGHALLRIDRVALTANTITYGVAGDTLSYWTFFPTDMPGYGRIPAWGFADVLASAHPDLAVGRRLYGYLPMSTHLLIAPDQITAHGLIDGTAHRQEMSPIYNHYSFCDADPAYSPAQEAHIAVFRPLFTTAFLLADFHRENEMFGATQLLLSSASSKTAIGLAAEFARTRPAGCTLVGLTSPGNIAFVENLGLYDQVLRYDDLTSLPRDPAAYVDFSGNGALLRAIHTYFGDVMRHTSQVGLTDWQHAELRIPDLPGPKPEFFFAPSYAQTRIKAWGAEAFHARLGAAWAAFMDQTTWLTPRDTTGAEAVRRRYLATLQGDIAPEIGDMVSMWAA